MTWLADHWGEVWTLLLQHVWLAAVPLVLGLVIALPLGWAARRWRAAYPVLVTTSGLLYTVPSLALFILMPLILSTRILDPINVVAAMTVPRSDEIMKPRLCDVRSYVRTTRADLRGASARSISPVTAS